LQGPPSDFFGIEPGLGCWYCVGIGFAEFLRGLAHAFNVGIGGEVDSVKIDRPGNIFALTLGR
jgi:hypothetical protein